MANATVSHLQRARTQRRGSQRQTHHAEWHGEVEPEVACSIAHATVGRAAVPPYEVVGVNRGNQALRNGSPRYP